MTGLTCFVCGVPLAGGVDTFGPHDRQVCQACHLSAALTDAEQEAADLAELQATRDERDALIFDLSEIDAELAPLVAQVKALRAARKAAAAELAAVDKRLAEKWGVVLPE